MGGPCTVPSPFGPWHDAQRSWKSVRPILSCSAEVDGAAAGAAEPACRPASPQPETRAMAASRTATRTTICRRGRSLILASPNDEDGREKPDPHEVDEGPVVGGHL